MRTLGKYQLIEKIGVGGFGEVYKGFDPYIKRHVAVKTCSSESEEMRTRFFQEAEIAGNLHHKNITTVYDFGLQEGLPYLIQEYLSGEDLDRKIKRREFLPYPEKLFYLLQTARGLAYAHSKGVIHRDIKPANIRILEDGTTKIMDFGIAKLQQQESGLTQTGMTLGTAAYLAPEQIRGDSVDLSTDVFSFGVLAYELLAYERPFPGDQISAVLYALLHEKPPPVTDHWPSAPDDIVEVIERCLCKEAGERYASAGDLLQRLERIQKQGRPAVSAAADEPDSGPAEPPPSAEADAPSLGEVDISLGGSHRAEDFEGNGEASPPAASTAERPAVSPAEMAETLRQRSRLEETMGHARVASGADGAPRWLWWVVIGALAAFAGFFGWWIGTRGQGDAEVTSPPPVVETQDVTSPGPAPAETRGNGENSESESESETTGAADSDPTDAATTPAKGQLVLRPPPWTDAMVVQVNGGVRRALDREITLGLDAGRHRVVFDLAEAGYRVRRTRTVVLEPGGREILSPPIEEPGFLVVRPLPRTPQAMATLDDGEPMATPLNGVPVAPGEHQLVLRSRRGGGQPLSRNLVVRSGERTIVAFDLDARRIDLID